MKFTFCPNWTVLPHDASAMCCRRQFSLLVCPSVRHKQTGLSYQYHHPVFLILAYKTSWQNVRYTIIYSWTKALCLYKAAQIKVRYEKLQCILVKAMQFYLGNVIIIILIIIIIIIIMYCAPTATWLGGEASSCSHSNWAQAYTRWGRGSSSCHMKTRPEPSSQSRHCKAIDFSNTFNCVRRDVILDAVAANTPEIYCMVHAAYSCEPILACGDHQLAQLGSPCCAPFLEKAHSREIRWDHYNFARPYIHYLLIFSHQWRLVSWTTLLSQEISKQSRQTSTLSITICVETGLKLNINKCEIITEQTVTIPDSSILAQFVKVTKDEMTLLGHHSP